MSSFDVARPRRVDIPAGCAVIVVGTLGNVGCIICDLPRIRIMAIWRISVIYINRTDLAQKW